MGNFRVELLRTKYCSVDWDQIALQYVSHIQIGYWMSTLYTYTQRETDRERERERERERSGGGGVVKGPQPKTD